MIHTDGASRGNPGAAAIAYVINGLATGKVEYKLAIGTFSNNQAEYRALLAALEKLVELGISNELLNFFADSELMIKQVIGEYRVKDINLKPLFNRVEDLIIDLEGKGNQLQFTAVRRERNVEADRLANEALDGQ